MCHTIAMVIVLICRSFVKVLGNPGCAPGSHFEICCSMLSEIWFSSCFTFVHYISLILSCILNPSATHTRDSACGNLVDLVMWSSSSLRDLLRLQVHLSVCVSHSVVFTLCNPHGQYPARLFHSWNSPGRNTGVGCHFQQAVS